MLKNNAKKRQLVKLGIALSLLISSVTTFAGDDAKLLYSTDAVVHGKKLNAWSAEWAQYVLAAPNQVNPVQDLTGDRCTFFQHGPVWFFEGMTETTTPVVRTCSIPAGKSLFFPIVNLLDINVTHQPVAELRAEIKTCLDTANNLSLTIDGQAIPARTLLRTRVRSVPFEAVIPDKGVPTIPSTPAGIYSPAVADGYYAMLRPLPVGQHTVHFTGNSPGCDYAPTHFHSDGWVVDVTYNLTVVPVSLR